MTLDFILIITNYMNQGSIVVRFMFRERILCLIYRNNIGTEQVQNRRINQEAVVIDQAIDVDNLGQDGGNRDGEMQRNLRYILKTECGEFA